MESPSDHKICGPFTETGDWDKFFWSQDWNAAANSYYAKPEKDQALVLSSEYETCGAFERGKDWETHFADPRRADLSRGKDGLENPADEANANAEETDMLLETCPQCRESECFCAPCALCNQRFPWCGCGTFGTRTVRFNRGDFFMRYVAHDRHDNDNIIFGGDVGGVCICSNPFPFLMQCISNTWLTNFLSKTFTRISRLVGSVISSMQGFHYEMRRARHERQERKRGTQALARLRRIVGGPTDPVTDDYNYVIDRETLVQMLEELSQIPREPDSSEPWLGIDMEAENLSHNSKLSYLQIADYRNNQAYLIDLLTLADDAWTCSTADGITLRDILEDSQLLKLIFDTRQDSACLYGQAGVRLQGMIDVQILCLLNNSSGEDSVFPEFRRSLAKSVKEYAGMTYDDYKEWLATKGATSDHSIWSERPTSAEAKLYAVQDTTRLRPLYDGVSGRLTDFALECARDWTAEEVRLTWCTQQEYDMINKQGRVSKKFSRYWKQQEREQKPLRRAKEQWTQAGLDSLSACEEITQEEEGGEPQANFEAY